jgi:bifunctional non-homologous end joining protein LigD
MIDPMLAYDNHGILPVVDDGWWMEPKFDGVRWQVHKVDGCIRSAIGRNGNDKTGKYPEIDEHLYRLMPEDTILDGELVDLPGGKRFVAFDVLMYAAMDVMHMPQEHRRQLLTTVIPPDATLGDLVAVTPKAPVDPRVHQAWLDFGMEGSVVKRAAGKYLAGKRSRDWLKVKPQSTSEGIVVGYKMGEGQSNQHRIGALKIQIVDTLAYTTVGYDGDPKVFPQLQGRMLEFAHHGINPETGKARHPVFKRWRDDRDVA